MSDDTYRPASSLPGELEAFAATTPGHQAVVAGDGNATAEELAEAAARFGAGLLAAGLERGDAVGLLLPNGLRWLVAALGINYAGMTCVPLNTWYKSEELARTTERSGMAMIVSQRTFFGRDYAAILGEAHLLERGPGRYQGTVLWEASGDLPFLGVEESDVDALRQSARAGAVAPERPAYLVFTSGSTAEPKIVPLYGSCLTRNAYEMGRRQGLQPGDRLWMAAPLFFGYGCANAIPVALTHRNVLCLQERFDPMESARFIEEQRCTVYYGLGPMTRALVASGAAAAHDLSSLRTGTTGFSPEDKRLVIEVLGVTGVCSVYGLTEGYGHSAMTDTADLPDVKLHSQGRVVPSQELRIADVVTGNPIDQRHPDAIGEIQLRGCVTPAYLNDPIANKASFTSDGWFRTGDLGWLDGDERLHFCGRIKEIVKVKGITVSPADVELAISAHPDVEQAYVFGWGPGGTEDEVLCCALVLRPGVVGGDDGATTERIAAWLQERVASYKVPERLALLSADEVPTTDTGKVSKRLIGERLFAPSS